MHSHQSNPNVILEVAGDGFFLEITASMNGLVVGRLDGRFRNQKLKILDLRVDEYYPTQNRLKSIVVVFGFSSRTSCRRRGIGSKLLARAVEAAQQAGAIEIWGVIVATDLTKAPWLPKWYQRRGFEVVDPDHECMQEHNQPVSKVVFSLSPEHHI